MTKEEIKQIREQLNLTRIQLARKIGYTRQHIYNVETGKKGFSKRFVEKIELLIKKEIA